MIRVPIRLSTALRAAVIVVATAAFFVIATRHFDLPGLYYDEALFYPPAAKLYAATAAFKPASGTKSAVCPLSCSLLISGL